MTDSRFSIKLAEEPKLLVAEDLIDDYTNGNLGRVRKALSEAPPLVAAIVAVDLYRFLMMQSRLEDNHPVHVFLERLRAWQA
jgi:hypothetical protein